MNTRTPGITSNTNYSRKPSKNSGMISTLLVQSHIILIWANTSVKCRDCILHSCAYHTDKNLSEYRDTH